MSGGREERDAYKDALGHVLRTRTADSEILRALTPHIPADNLAGLLDDHRAVALPGVAVDGAVWRLQSMVTGEFHLRTLRLPESFLSHNPRHARFQPPGLLTITHYVAEALAHGREHWGSHLLRDDYPSAVRVELRHPAEPGDDLWVAGGKLLATAYGFLLLGGWEIQEQPEDRRRSIFEQSLRHVGVDPINGLERVASSPEKLYYCAVCGGVLDLVQCLGCGRQFPRDKDRFTTTNIPMARVIYEKFLALGLDLPFEVAPM